MSASHAVVVDDVVVDAGTVASSAATISELKAAYELISIADRKTKFCQLVTSPTAHPNKSVPDGAVLFPVTSRSYSIIFKYGVRLRWTVSEAIGGGKEKIADRWFCLFGDCVKNPDCRGGVPIRLDTSSTGLATSHLRDSHGIEPDKTKNQARNACRMAELINMNRPGFLEDPVWFYSLLCSTYGAIYGLSYNSYRPPSWNLQIHFLSGLDEK